MIRSIGIDLGTTNTVAAMMKKGVPREIQNQKGKYSTPSVVALSKNHELLVGEDAKSKNSFVASFKRDMGTDKKYSFNDMSYSPLELSSIILHHVKSYVEEILHEPVLRAVITVPAWFSEKAIFETREAGRMAGFFVTRTYTEPMAAALAYGFDLEDPDPKTILVYDLGGGTFDISVLMVTPGTFSALDHEGDVYLGGDDFDMLIMKHVREQVRINKGKNIPEDLQNPFKNACEQVKIDLSARERAEINLPAFSAGLNIEMDIMREQFEKMLYPWISGTSSGEKKSTMTHTREAIVKSNLSADTIDNILLVGGSTYIPLVRRILGQEFGDAKILKSVNPMLCVAHGAAIETALVSEINCPKCHHKNNIDKLQCDKCKTTLIGEDRITCPKCFLPSPVTKDTCWKCGHSLRKKAQEGKIATPVKRCPEGHENVITSDKCAVCGYTWETGGINCPNCGHSNKAGGAVKDGNSICEKCGEILNIQSNVTAKSKGIKLIDSTFSCIVPKGTVYPMEEPMSQVYKTPDNDIRELLITSCEGQSTLAEENDWVGNLILDLPSGLPKGTEVEISISADDDSVQLVSAKLVNQPTIGVMARIRRSTANLSDLKEIEEMLREYVRVRGELNDTMPSDQKSKFLEVLEELERIKQAQDTEAFRNRKTEFQRQIDNMKKLKYVSLIVNYAEAAVSHYKEYLTYDDQEKIRSLIRETKSAVDQGNVTDADTKAHKLEDFLDSNGILVLIMNATGIANHPKVPRDLSNEIYTALDALKSAIQSGNKSSAQNKANELEQLINRARVQIPGTDPGGGPVEPTR
jgi:molecular chaperone DnaK (HSP70)